MRDKATGVEFFLDVVSPYTWLALMGSERFARQHGVRFEVRPVVYAALLDAHGLVGPVETTAKRRYTAHDVARCAARLGLRLVGPPAHPFRSLEAQRVLVAFRDRPEALALAVRLADACWGAGQDLTDPGVRAAAVAAVGLDAAGLEERIASAEVKLALRRSTDEALARSVFGVPTFALGNELFWGHDRLDDLARRLDGSLPETGAEAERFLARPRGVDRRRPRTPADGTAPLQ
jgi:2-hydroxychromene-2-carboxylate isomerase